MGQSMKQAPFKGTPLADSIDKCLAQVPPTISAPEIYPSTGSEENLIFTAQTVVKNDKTIGIVVFQLDPKQLANIFAMNEGMGTTGEAQAVRRTGNEVRMITVPRSDPDGVHRKKRYTMGGSTGVAMQNAVNKTDGFGNVVDYRGVPVLAAWGYAPTLDVGVVTKVDREEALRGINSLRWIGMWLLGLDTFGSGSPRARCGAIVLTANARGRGGGKADCRRESDDPGQHRGGGWRNGVIAALDFRDERSSPQSDQAHPGIDRYGHVDHEPDRRRGQAARNRRFKNTAALRWRSPPRSRRSRRPAKN